MQNTCSSCVCVERVGYVLVAMRYHAQIAANRTFGQVHDGLQLKLPSWQYCITP
jgi:hypothetical protein